MATFTITTAVNIDTCASKAGSDTYNINGGYLTVDSHTRYGVNQNTSAGMGNIAMSASLGGTIEFNSTKVRLIPFNSGSGNVPSLDTTITQGGATGKLLGVYSAINVAPTAAASAMPATGYILIRQWNDVSYSAGALGGITATATGADRAGWLEIVGVDALAVTVNRLNTFKVRGDYYDFLGATTDGNRATTYQLPTNGSIVYLPGVEVETSVAGVYEFYPCAGSKTALLANIATDEVRGKWCWISTAGLVRFGHDGTNSTGGYCPPSGRKIRIPNIFFMCCTSGALTANVLPNATLGTRMEFVTSGGAVIDIDKASINWYMNINQPFSVSLTNTFILSALVLTECASPISWSNVGVGQEAANTQFGLTMSLNFAGGTMNKCVWTRALQASSGNYVTTWADCSGFAITNERVHSLTKGANAATGSYTMTRINNSSWSNTTLGGGRAYMVTCSDIIFTNTVYYDNPATTTGTAFPMYVFDIASNCIRCKYDGVSWGGLPLVQAYSGILNIGAAGCADIKLRNIGTANTPLDMGGSQVNATWTRSAAVATVTTPTDHGLKTGDIIYCLISSDTGAITVAAKTLTGAATSTTFTFACTNGGATSGTLVYYPIMSALVCVLAAGAAANNVKVQRVYTEHTRTGIMTGDNSSKNITLENVWGSHWGAQLVPELNCTMSGIIANPALTAQTSVYGTHFLDCVTTGSPVNTDGVTWNRTTTVATVTSTAHGLRTGDSIVVTVTSDAGAIVKGVKSITATTANAFTFTCINGGGSSGTLTFIPLNSKIVVQMNEPTADTSSLVSLSGGAAFTSAGGLYMPTVNQQAEFISPRNIIGYTSFPIAEAVMAGGTIGNYDITYSLNNGTNWYNLYYPRAGGGGSKGAYTITMTDTTGVLAGDYVWGTNVGYNAKVQSVDNGTTITVDTPNIGTVSSVLRFNHLPSSTISDASIGTPLRIRIKTSKTNSTAITSLYAFALSNSESRAYTYPLDVSTLLFSGLQPGSEVRCYTGTDPATAVEIGGIDSSGITFSFQHSSGGSAGFIRILNTGYVPISLQYTYSSNNAELLIQQNIDRSYI